MSTNYFKCVAVLTALLSCSGCLESDHALSNPDDAELVSELMGTWVQDPPEDDLRWTIAAAGDGFPKGMHRLTKVENGRLEGKLFFITNIGDCQYANLLNYEDDSSLPTTWQPKHVKDYTLIQFEVKNKTAKVFEIKEAVLNAAISKGELKRRVLKESDSPVTVSSERLSSTTVELHRYVSQNCEQLTGKVLVKYRRQE